MKFKEGQLYEITRLDADIREDKQKYKARFSHMTDNLVVFDYGLYMISEIKKNYRKTWKVRSL